MKKTLILAIAMLVSLAGLKAQECSTAWPYLYPSFQEGTIYMAGGTKIVQQVNVHVLHGRLHYLDNGLVKEALSKDILLIQIGEDKYMAVEGNIMKVVASEERGFVASHQVGDFDKLRESGGAYGTSTTNSATQKLTSLDIAGKVNQNHMEMWESRHNGELLDLVNTYYLVTPQKVWKATKKSINDALDADGKAAFKAWLKSHKIKWNNPDSLLTLLDFVTTLQ